MTAEVRFRLGGNEVHPVCAEREIHLQLSLECGGPALTPCHVRLIAPSGDRIEDSSSQERVAAQHVRIHNFAFGIDRETHANSALNVIHFGQDGVRWRDLGKEQAGRLFGAQFRQVLFFSNRLSTCG